MSEIRIAKGDEFALIWPTLRQVCRAGDVFTQPRDIDEAAAYDYWMTQPRQTYVYVADGQVLGSYYIRTNQLGGGSHVCNAGYLVAEQARGLGLAKKMCQHSLLAAADMGYRAMQFNFVVSSNEAAVNAWLQMGFEIVGRLPEAFEHPSLGFVDALVMSRSL